MPPLAPSRTALIAVLALAVLAIGVAGPLVRLAAAPALAIAFWRMLFSTALTGGFWIAGRKGPARGDAFGAREWLLAAAGGVCLAAHFACWITSLSMTTVAASVVLVNTMPLFAALWAALFLRESATGGQWLGIAAAVAGVALISCEDAGGEGTSRLGGNLLAIGGAATGAGYFVIGRRLRQKTTLWAYVTRVYGLSAVALLGLSLAAGTRLAPWPAADWIIFGALALGPGLLGHTLLNWTLRWLSAPVVNVVALGEPVVAAGLAALLPAIDEVPGVWTLAGSAVILGGIALVVSCRPAASAAVSSSPQ